MEFNGIYPLVNVYITNWKITMLLMGKSTILIRAMFKFANCNKLPEGIILFSLQDCLFMIFLIVTIWLFNIAMENPL